MGLGKTLQTITFLSSLVHIQKSKGLHLVVVPLSVLFNWMAEFKKFCPSMKVQRVHATSDAGEIQRLKDVIRDTSRTEVVLTTYDTLKTGGLSRALHAITWRTVILDEGHRIKNDDSDVARSCQALHSRFKVILTGTPVQNNLHETYSLLFFLMPHIFQDSQIFDTAFDLNSRNNNSKHNANGTININRDILNQAHYLIRPFILRRLKSEVEQKLPFKLETKINCPMSEMQKFWIKLLLLKERNSLNRLLNKDSHSINDKNAPLDIKKLCSLLAQLRKAANHPYLFPGSEIPTPDGRATEEIVTASGKMIILDSLLKKLLARNHRVVLFSQYTRTLDIINDYLTMRGIIYLRLDGSTNRVMREVYINMFNRPNSEYNVFCLSTRAGGEGVNLFTADTVILFDSDWNPQIDIQAAG